MREKKEEREREREMCVKIIKNDSGFFVLK